MRLAPALARNLWDHVLAHNRVVEGRGVVSLQKVDLERARTARRGAHGVLAAIRSRDRRVLGDDGGVHVARAVLALRDHAHGVRRAVHQLGEGAQREARGGGRSAGERERGAALLGRVHGGAQGHGLVGVDVAADGAAAHLAGEVLAHLRHLGGTAHEDVAVELAPGEPRLAQRLLAAVRRERQQVARGLLEVPARDLDGSGNRFRHNAGARAGAVRKVALDLLGHDGKRVDVGGREARLDIVAV